MTTTNESRQDCIERSAESEFEDHVLKRMSRPDDYAQVFECWKLGTNVMSFVVTVWPGYLSVQGDIGGLVVHRYGSRDMIEWARSAVGSPDYFFSNVANRNHDMIVDWDDENFERWLEYSIEDDKESVGDGDYENLKWTQNNIDMARCCLVLGGSKSKHLYDFLHQSMGFDDAQDDVVACENYTVHAWWFLECVKKFLELLALLEAEKKP